LRGLQFAAPHACSCPFQALSSRSGASSPMPVLSSVPAVRRSRWHVARHMSPRKVVNLRPRCRPIGYERRACQEQALQLLCPGCTAAAPAAAAAAAVERSAPFAIARCCPISRSARSGT
jgi:hypothetical protein